MDLKHIIIPDGVNFDAEHMAFLKTIDGGFAGLVTEKDKLQKQINDIYIRMQDSPLVGGGVSTEQKNLTADWIRNFMKRKDTSQIEQRLKSFETKQFTEFQNTLDPGLGGVLVPELLLAEIWAYVEAHGICRRDMRYLPFTGAGNTRRIPRELTGINVQWLDEAESKPVSGILYDEVTQILGKLAVIVITSEELLEDAAVDLISFTAGRIAQVIAREEDAQFLAGVGNPWNGVLSVGVPVPMGVGLGIADIVPEDFLTMIYTLPRGWRDGAKFYVSSEVIARLMAYRSSVVAAGDNAGIYLVTQPTDPSFKSLWGYPVVVTDVLPDSSTVTGEDEPFAIFANLAKTAVYGDKKGLRIKLLDQATILDESGEAMHLAQRDCVALRVHKRVGYVSVMPQGIAVLYTGPVS